MSDPRPNQQGIGVEVRGLRKSFNRLEVLKGVDFEVKPGEIFVLMGPSGSGKSVLLKHVIGLEQPDAGEILLQGKPIQSSNVLDEYRLAMVFQSGALLNSLTVGENVGLYLREHQLKSPEEITRIVAEKLEDVGLKGTENKMPSELSGGMKKRVAIARALVIEPQLILYDEPTSELDPVSAVLIAEEIVKLNTRIQVTSLVVSHDRDLAFGVADRIAVIDQGTILALGTPQEVKNSHHPVVRDFLTASYRRAESSHSPDCFCEPDGVTTLQQIVMKNSLETRLGIFVALAVIAAVLILEIVGGIERFQRGYELKALFSTIQDLKEGDHIKMAGVEVGRVEKITLDETNNKVLVTLKLHKNVQVRTDSVASIKFTGLMGQNFVNLDFGKPGSPIAEPGTVLSSAEQPDLGAMLAKLDNVASGVENLTKSFTGDKIDNLLGPFTDFLKANRVPLTVAIANLQAVSSQIAQGKGSVGKMIYDESLYNSAYAAVTNLEDTANAIKATVADARKVVDQVNAGQGSIGKLLHDETLYTETTASMTTLKEILQKINQGQGTIGKIVNDQELYSNAKLTLQKLNQATEGLEDQGPLSVLGTAVGKLF